MNLSKPRFEILQTSPPLIANSGVILEHLSNALIRVAPNLPSTLLKPCIMPMLPGRLLERPSRLVRYALTRRLNVTALLYLDVRFSRWSVWTPPHRFRDKQVTTLDLRFSGVRTRPHDFLRLAGSFSSADARMFHDWPATIPHFDGLHLFLHRRRWGEVSTVIVAQGVPLLVEPTGVLCESLDAADRSLLPFTD